MADEQSGIPKYMTGESLSGGAGRTASGLNMLMGNAEKVLQTVSANIDTDVLEPLLEHLYDMVMLTDTSGMLSGEEEIRVLGSEAATEHTAAQQKRLQFLQITANPIDAQIIGEVGRARLLRALAQDLDLPDDIIPDDQTLQSQIQAQKQLQAAAQALQQHANAAGVPVHPENNPNQRGHPGGPGGAGAKGIASPPGAGGGGAGPAGPPGAPGQPAPSMPPGGPGGSGAPPGGGPPQMNSFSQGIGGP